MKCQFSLSTEHLLSINRKLAHLTRSDCPTQSLRLFVQTHSLFSPDHYTLSAALAAAAKARHLTFGAQLHAHAVRSGLRAHPHVANSLLSLYAQARLLASVKRAFHEIPLPDAYSWTTLLSACAKLDGVRHALQVFEQIPNRHVPLWNAVITGCAQKGYADAAFILFRDMQRMDVKADKFTFATMLSLCSLELLDCGRHVHSVAVKNGILGWTSVVNSLITMYFKCGCVLDACEVFEEAVESVTCDYVTYNAMIDGFVSVERSEDAFLMFRDMQKRCFGPTEVTFVSVMSSCLCLRVGCQAQAQAIKMGFIGCVAVNNAMMTMYSGFGEVDEVLDIFEGMEDRDVVSWNIMVSTFLQENLGEEAMLSYLKMRQEGIEPDEFTYGSLLVALDSLQVVEMIHSLLCKSGLVKIEVLNALVSAYCRHGKIKRAFQIFSDVPYKNLISWNSIISGFFMNGLPLQGLEQFSALVSTHVKPNAYSLSLVLSICSTISAMNLGKQIHGYILTNGFSSEVSLGNALVTMYSKCGLLDRALRVFDAMVERDTISWNAVISAYAQHGRGEEAVCCFKAMQTTPGIKPDQATFTSVLSACSHAGLVDDGACIFDTMVKLYGFVPSVDHFSCIVDLLGRSGYLDEAERVIEGGYFGAHSNICWSLFSACAAHGNLSLGRTVARLILERDHNNPSVYVLLSNIYAAAGQWEEAANLRDIMREFGTTKQPGCKIKKAYYKLALRLHPDRNSDDEEAKAKFQQLQNVSSIRGDEEKRAIYDQTGCVDDAVTEADIEEFEANFRGSDTEKNYLIDLYKKYKGNMNRFERKDRLRFDSMFSSLISKYGGVQMQEPSEEEFEAAQRKMENRSWNSFLLKYKKEVISIPLKKMTKGSSEPAASGSGGFHALHAERDLQSNWEVDLAKKLEEYLLKICSGEITGEEEGNVHVNFAEAALLLQGSIQVYSRKVEYLYSLVLRALEFLSQKRQQEHIDGASGQREASGQGAVTNEENDEFWGLDDIPVEEKNSLDGTTGKEVNLDHFIKPPANLVVLEGDCLDAGGDGGELESFLLSTTDLYQDFILLDTSDVVAVHEFLKVSKAATTQNDANRGTSARKSFLSPRCTGGSARRLSADKTECANFNCPPKLNCGFDDENVQPSSPASAGLDDCNYGFDMDHGCDASRDSDNSDDDDPWKPLNPHEPGNLRVKPFRKVKALKKNSINVRQQVPMSNLFPLAKLHGPISPELMEMWEMRHHVHERQKDSQAPLYEKLRQSLVNENETGGNPEVENDDNDNNEYDSGNPDFDMPDNAHMEEDLPPFRNEHEFDDTHVDAEEAVDLSQTSLEDLCRSHLNSLLASIAETEKQTEMAARVSTWKQRIEHNLEEQESHPPFDIQDYGESILENFSKLSLEASSSSSVLSFSDLVKGQEKYDVARSFSSLLQLVNNGEVALLRNGVDGESVCFTSVNPFHVKLLKQHGKKKEDAMLRLSKKRAKSPTKKPSTRGDRNKPERDKSASSSRKHGSTRVSPPTICKFSVKLGKVSAAKLSPEAKRRRRSQFVEPVNLHSTG
ncbi:hypothetical protein VNO78_21300 [Psophocarpus tetragonolobus]|uniref:Condensin-2 complex subunit H2 n=1 Tax=Psophocarpus tetragonolobus TaxID=3891 RepID=A0AAN9SBU6_PSOTE